MRTRLNEYDFERLPYGPKIVRWRNTAQWRRNTLTGTGESLMDSDLPRHIGGNI